MSSRLHFKEYLNCGYSNISSFSSASLSSFFIRWKPKNPYKEITVKHIQKQLKLNLQIILTEHSLTGKCTHFFGVLFCPLCMIADIACLWAHLMDLVQFLKRFSNQIQMSILKCIQFDRGLPALNGSMCWQHMKSVRAHSQLMSSSWNHITNSCTAKEISIYFEDECCGPLFSYSLICASFTSILWLIISTKLRAIDLIDRPSKENWRKDLFENKRECFSLFRTELTVSLLWCVFFYLSELWMKVSNKPNILKWWIE